MADRCPKGMEIQTILFDKEYFTKRTANTWIKKHNYKNNKIDETEDYFRIRQKSPSNFEKHSYRTIEFKPGIKAIVACPKKKVNMATRKRRRNSAVRINPDEQSEVSITIKGPKEALAGIGSDLAMTAANEGIPATRYNPKRRKTRKTTTRTKKELPSMTKVFGNPIHIPRTNRGRPAKDAWWILDLFDGKGKKITTHIGKGEKKAAEYEAANMINKRAKGRGKSRIVRSAALSGPYSRKPNTRTKRK